ncbi:MAG: disulfide bond formation protein B [Alsobacter sp.]
MSATAASVPASFLTPARAAVGVAVVAVAAILGALFIQYVLGVLPCELCLKQRIPYYTGIPLALAAALLAARSPRGRVTVTLLLLVALVFAAGAVLGIYHTGVEYGAWQGPTDCTGPVGAAVGMNDFLKSLETVKVVRCDEVAMRIFGLSLAAWNALLALGMTALALAGARAAARA